MQVDAALRIQTRSNDPNGPQVIPWSLGRKCVGRGCTQDLPHGYNMAVCPNCRRVMNDVQPEMPQRQSNESVLCRWGASVDPVSMRPGMPMPPQSTPVSAQMQFSQLKPLPPGVLRLQPLPVPQQAPTPQQQQPVRHHPPAPAPAPPPRPVLLSNIGRIVAPHFNSRGELLDPPHLPPCTQPRVSANNWPYPPTHPLRPRHQLRMCARRGCGSILPQGQPYDMCSRCMTGIQAERYQHQVQAKAQLRESLRNSKVPEGSAKSPIDVEMADGTTSANKEMASHLPTPPTSSCSPTMPPVTFPSKPQPKKVPSVKLKLKIPSRPSSSLPTPATPTPEEVGAPNGSARCSTFGCEELLEKDSVSARCTRCIRKHWKSRPERKLLKKIKMRKKVTWAADVEGGEAGDVVMASEDDEGNKTNGKDLSRSGSSTPVSDMEASPISNSKGGIMGWDSDLTDLTPSDVSSEDESSSGDEEVTPSEPSGLKIRIPRRPSVSKPVDTSDAAPDQTSSTPESSEGPSASVTPDPPASSSSPELSKEPSASVTPDPQASSSSSPGPPVLCANRKCSTPLAHGYRWKSCVSCRLRGREYQRKRQGLKSRHVRLDGDTTTVDFLPTHRYRPEELVPGARLCSVKSCTHVLPSKEEYKFKFCDICRIRTWSLQKKRKKLALSASNGADMDVDGDDNMDEALIKQFHATPPATKGQENRPPGRCRSRDCGLLIVSDSSESLCRQCKARRGQPPRLKLKAPRDCMRNGVNENPPPYPEYKNYLTLLSTFQNRLSGFFRTQLLYLHLKSKKQQQLSDDEKMDSKETNPIAVDFRFAGEHSVVALDHEIEKRLDEVKEKHMKIKDDIAETTKLEFNPSMWISVLKDGGGVMTRFVCIYKSEQPALLADLNPPTPVRVKSEEETSSEANKAAQPPPSAHSTTPAKAPLASPAAASPSTITKPMRGELEVATFPDRTHLLFPGERTIIRFRLVG